MKYSGFSKVLHHIVLGNAFLARSLFDMELDLFAKTDADSHLKRHVFISGLARSGTTSILQKLYATGQFRSLTYLDMPFVLTPNLWKKISGKRISSSTLEERAHGDGILVNYESPEAFEEVFWKMEAGKDYIREQFLVPHSVSEEVIDQFRQYVAAVLNSSASPEQNRYLSKNNNNILRVPSLVKALPNALILAPFRDPVSHAASLLSQHQRFLKVNTDDSFSRHYMAWLGHFEFGLNHKPFHLSADFPQAEQFAPQDINYWLVIWHNYYRYALENFTGHLRFVSFKNLCESPFRSYEILSGLAEADIGQEDLSPYSPPVKKVTGADAELLEKCNQLYEKLEKKAVN